MLYASKLVAPPDRYDDDDDDNELFWGWLLYSGKELLLSTRLKVLISNFNTPWTRVGPGPVKWKYTLISIKLLDPLKY